MQRGTNYMINLLLFFLSIFFAVVVQAETSNTINYTLDPLHSYVLWRINHFGFSNPSGKWMAQGTLVLDERQPNNSHVNVTINVADITTGIPALDKHLQGPLFFYVEKFPTATFVSNKVVVTRKNTAKITGLLTIRGVTKPLILDATLNKMGINPINNLETAGFSATTSLKRSDFGINTLLPDLGDNVQLQIEVEANKAKNS
jgi:polyisoprenoid-binding protein YceI